MGDSVDDRVLLAEFRKAAERVVYSWPGVVSADDLSQELWVWYLEQPSVRSQFVTLPAVERVRIATRQGHRLASKKREADARFSRELQYSVENVKAALAGETIWRELVEDLAAGLESLKDRNPAYAGIIQSRYFEGQTPDTQSGRDRLKNAHKALTEEVNRVVREKFSRFEAQPGRTLGDGPGSKKRVFPRDVGIGRTVFDETFRGEEMNNYRGWAIPEMYPDVRPAQIRNWHEDDREDFPE